MGMLSVVAGGNGISTNEGRLLLRGPGEPPPSVEAERLDAWQSRLGDIGGPRSWTDIPLGLGAGRQHAAALVQERRLRRRRARAADRALARARPAGPDPRPVSTTSPTSCRRCWTCWASRRRKATRAWPRCRFTARAWPYSFEDPDADSSKGVQYFEMWGHRAIWMDGWKAVTRHFRGTPYEDDQWELFNLEEDFSEIHDLSEQEPERLQRMIDRWWIEAGRYKRAAARRPHDGHGRPQPTPGQPPRRSALPLLPADRPHPRARLAAPAHRRLGNHGGGGARQRRSGGRPLRLRQHGRRHLALHPRQPPLPRLQLP